VVCLARNLFRFKNISGGETSHFPERVESGLTFYPESGFFISYKEATRVVDTGIPAMKIPPISLDIKMIVK